MASGLACRFIARVEDCEGEADEPSGGILGVEFERVEAGGRLLVEIGLARVDQSVEMVTRQIVAPDCGGEGLDHLVLAQGQTAIDRIDRLAPPLQPDAAEERLMHDLARLRHPEIEAVEADEVAPPAARGTHRFRGPWR